MAEMDLDSAPADERELLDEIDSYYDDLGSRLIVLRLVNDSVVKGMVTAVEQEAAETIALKDAEIAKLRKHLEQFESVAAELTFESGYKKEENEITLSMLSHDHQHTAQLHECDEHLIINTDTSCSDICCLLEDAATEQQCKVHIKRLVSSVVLKNAMSEFRDQLVRLCCGRSVAKRLPTDLGRKLKEIYTLFEQLGSIFKSFLDSELGILVSQFKSEDLDDSDCRSKSQPRPNVSERETNNVQVVEYNESDKDKEACSEFSELKSMGKEESIKYLMSEMTKMKREHDVALQQKTEEIFLLKRELLREKGSNPLHLKRYKGYEVMREKILEALSKLDEIFLENESLIFVDDSSLVCNPKADGDVCLMLESKYSGTLAENAKEACSTNARENGSFFPSPLESGYEELTERLEFDCDGSWSLAIAGEIENTVDIECQIHHEIFSDVHKEVIGDAMLRMFNSFSDYLKAWNAMKSGSPGAPNESGPLLHSLIALTRDNQQFLSNMEHIVTDQRHKFDMISSKLGLFEDKISEQDVTLYHSMMEVNVIITRLEEAMQKTYFLETVLGELSCKLEDASDFCNRTEMQNKNLRDVVNKNESSIALLEVKRAEHETWMHSLMLYLSQLGNSVDNFQYMILQRIECCSTRLCSVNHQLHQMVRLFREQTLHYKELSEIRGSNLQKAEAEVDFLGDDVSALLDLLRKVYAILDHYSPVLKHFPGVLELLTLIEREEKRERNR